MDRFPRGLLKNYMNFSEKVYRSYKVWFWLEYHFYLQYIQLLFTLFNSLILLCYTVAKQRKHYTIDIIIFQNFPKIALLRLP